MDASKCVTALTQVFAARKIHPEDSILEYMGVMLASAGPGPEEAFEAIGETLCDHELATSPAQAKAICKEYNNLLTGEAPAEKKPEAKKASAKAVTVEPKKGAAEAKVVSKPQKGTSMDSEEGESTTQTAIPVTTTTSSSSSKSSTTSATTTTGKNKKKGGKNTKEVAEPKATEASEEPVVTIWAGDKGESAPVESQLEKLLLTLLPKGDPEMISLVVEVIIENGLEDLEEALSDVLISCEIVETSAEVGPLCNRIMSQISSSSFASLLSSGSSSSKKTSSTTTSTTKSTKTSDSKKPQAKPDQKLDLWVPVPPELQDVALFEGQILRARYYADGKWYSASLDAIMEDSFRVTFVQYGNSETVKLSDLKIEQEDILELQARTEDEKAAAGRTIAELQPDESALKAARKKADVDKKAVKKKTEALAKVQARKEAIERELEAQYVRREAERAKRAVAQRQLAMETYLKATATGAPRLNEVRIPDFSLPSLGGGAELITSAALTFTPGRRYGLVGRNGLGKTTLLRYIANYEVPGFPTFLRVVHVEQEVEPNELTVVASVLSADSERQWLIDEEKRLSSDKAGNDQALQKLFARMQEIDVWGAEARACAILSGLSFTQERMQQKTKDLSGGWRMRVALAQALFVNPDLLLLDEPTNHLDFPAVLWLEDYLVKYKNTLVIVSHDRAFINNVITDTVNLANRTLTYYKGNYEVFEKTRAEQLKQQKKEFEANKEKREHMQAFIDKFRANAKRASLVQSRIKALARIEVIEDVEDEGEWNFTFPDPGLLTASAVSCTKVRFGYTPDKILLTDVTCNVDTRSRIGIIGANGTGKSTLVKILLGELEPLNGEIKRNSQARIATFSQHHMDQLNLNLDSVENLLALYPKTHPQLIRRHLGSFGITGDLALQKVRTLSGGQKSRVAFALITWRKPHVIMMDEPTNHLDLETIDALIEALRKFGGGVVLISHDQHFLQSIGTEFWGVTGGTVKRFHAFSEARNFTYSSA